MGAPPIRVPSEGLGVWSGWSLCLKFPSEGLAVLLVKKCKNQTNKIIKRTSFRIPSVKKLVPQFPTSVNMAAEAGDLG